MISDPKKISEIHYKQLQVNIYIEKIFTFGKQNSLYIT